MLKDADTHAKVERNQQHAGTVIIAGPVAADEGALSDEHNWDMIRCLSAAALLNLFMIK